MGTTSPRRRSASSPAPSVADLSTVAHEHRCPCSSPGHDDGDDFELTPLLPLRRRCAHARSSSRTAGGTLLQPPLSAQLARRRPQQPAAGPPAARRVRWHEMAFGTVRVPSAMDVREIRRRLQARRGAMGEAPPPAASAAEWAPWRLIRSLSCKGVEAVAVAAAAAPVRLV